MDITKSVKGEEQIDSGAKSHPVSTSQHEVSHDGSAVNSGRSERQKEYLEKAYHNTELLLKKYRDFCWMLECYPDELATELEIPVGCLDRLISRVDTELGLENKKLEGRLISVTKSRLLIDRLNEAISMLKKKPKEGEDMYEVIYRLHISKNVLKSEDVCLSLNMSRRKVYYLRKKAIDLIANRLWGAPNDEILAWLEIMEALEKK